MLSNIGINLNNKNNSFDCFKKEKGFYVLVSIYNEREIKIEDDYKNHIEECYNFYSKYRHPMAHYKIIGKNDMSLVIDSYEYAIQILNECLEKFKPL